MSARPEHEQGNERRNKTKQSTVYGAQEESQSGVTVDHTGRQSGREEV